jgi:hypothetical protein
MDKPKLTRWHWRATIAPQQVGVPAGHVEVHLDSLHVAGGDLHVEGHELDLRYSDPHYPIGVGREHTLRHFITEEFRAHEARRVFWSVPISDQMTVRIGLAAPDARLGDDMSDPQVLRVSYEQDGHEWLVAPVSAANPGLSRIVEVAR